MRVPPLIVSALFIWLLPAQAALALESAWQSADYVQARLVTAQTAMGEGSFEAGLELRLEEGWHAYWRMPGEGGLPPVFNWGKSGNLAEALIDWPVPERIETFGLYSFGYRDHVLFPLAVTPADAGRPVTLELAAEIMVCKDICVPQSLALSLTVPAGPASPSRYERVLAESRARLPARDDTPALSIKSVIAGPDALIARVWSGQGFENVDLLVEAGDDIYLTSPPVIEIEKDDSRYATLRIAKPEGVENLATLLMNREITLTLVSGKTAIEKKINL